MTFQWTDDKVEAALELRAQGYSSSMIAEKIGAASRNAVCGLFHRRGLSTPRAIARQRAAAKRPRIRKPRPARAGISKPPKPLIPEPEPIYTGSPVHLTDTGRSLCKYVLDDAGMCCGAPVRPGTSWCPGHYRVVFTHQQVLEAAE